MTTDQPTDHDPRNGLISSIVHATMPDGSPISARVKAETILSQLGITDCPSTLVRLVSIGVGHKLRSERRWKESREGGASEASLSTEAQSDPVPEAMPQLHEIAPPRLVSRSMLATSRRELAQSKGPRLSRKDRARREGPERINRLQRTGFPLKEIVRITIKEPR